MLQRASQLNVEYANNMMHRKDIRNIASITAISISSETKTFFQLMKNTRPCSCMLFLHTVKISSHLLMCVALFGFHLPERRQMGSGAWIIEWQNQNKNTTITTMPFSLSSLSITADSIKAARTFGTKSQACQDRESFKLALGWHIISYMRLFLEMFFFFFHAPFLSLTAQQTCHKGTKPSNSLVLLCRSSRLHHFISLTFSIELVQMAFP